jgi:hypothetical protein
VLEGADTLPAMIAAAFAGGIVCTPRRGETRPRGEPASVGLAVVGIALGGASSASASPKRRHTASLIRNTHTHTHARAPRGDTNSFDIGGDQLLSSDENEREGVRVNAASTTSYTHTHARDHTHLTPVGAGCVGSGGSRVLRGVCVCAPREHAINTSP